MQNKICVLVGVLDKPESTNVWMAAAFRNLGYNIIPINYRNLGNSFGEHYNFVVSRFNPNLVVFSKINRVDPNIINKDVNSLYWFMDNIDVATSIDALKYAERCTYASATSSDVVELFKKVNSNSYHIIEGFDPNIYYKIDVEKDIDILFFGNATEKRVQFLSSLNKSVTIFGDGWPEQFDANPSAYLDDLRYTIARSKIILNLVHGNIFSDRVVTAMACGGFVLSEYCKDLFTFFNNEEHLVWFRDIDNCRNLIDIYLNEEEKREKIVQQGMEKVRNSYTWNDVVQRITYITGV